MNSVIERIKEFNRERDPQLVQLKYQLMQTDVFAFFRGTCHLFYQDWPTTSPLNGAPATWICGDLHLQNFGCYKGDNRLVYFNINDFDEASLASSTWDLARFVTGLLVAAPILKIDEPKALALCDYFLSIYTKTLAKGRVRPLDDDNAVGPARDLLFQVKRRPRTTFLDAHTIQHGNMRKLLINEKQTQSVTDPERIKVTTLLQQWGAQQLDPQFFTVLDVAHRIAGIGSLGVERYVVLVEGKGSPNQNYLLDFKAKPASSLQPYLQTRQPNWPDQAERSVTIQRWIQGISPALLAAIETPAQSYALREMQPTENKVNLEAVTGNMHHLEQLVKTMAKVSAWGQLRSAGRQGAADAHALIDFASASYEWQKELVHYAKYYVARVDEDYRSFCSAFKDGDFKIS